MSVSAVTLLVQMMEIARNPSRLQEMTRTMDRQMSVSGLQNCETCAVYSVKYT